MNAKKARAQRKDAEPRQPGVVSRLTPAELVYYRKTAQEALAAEARAQQLQAEAIGAQNAFVEKRGAFRSYGTHLLAVRQLDPTAHVIDDNGAITRRPAALPGAEPPADGEIKPGDQVEIPDERAS